MYSEHLIHWELWLWLKITHGHCWFNKSSVPNNNVTVSTVSDSERNMILWPWREFFFKAVIWKTAICIWTVPCKQLVVLDILHGTIMFSWLLQKSPSNVFVRDNLIYTVVIRYLSVVYILVNVTSVWRFYHSIW